MNATARPTEMLREGLRQLAVPDAESTGVRLSQFLDELERWNPRFGFVKAASREELIVKHVLDSLSAWKQVRDEALEGRVLDVGSGAGSPVFHWQLPLQASLSRCWSARQKKRRSCGPARRSWASRASRWCRATSRRFTRRSTW